MPNHNKHTPKLSLRIYRNKKLKNYSKIPYESQLYTEPPKNPISDT